MAEPFTGEDEQTPEARIASVFSVAAVGRAVGDLAAACGNSTHHHNTDSECHAENTNFTGRGVAKEAPNDE